jgi:predicted RecA/RadA family phage recombinase
MKNYVQDGEFIDYTAPSNADIASGQLVQVGDLHGVAVTAIPRSTTGSLALKGVFTLPKLTAAAGDATTLGGPVYFSAGSVSGAVGDPVRKLVGHALAVAAQAATTVQVRLSN